VGFAVLAPAAPIWSELGLITPATMGPRDGIYDERAYYASRTGLLATWGSTPMPFPGVPATVAAMKQAGQTVATRDAVGFFGYLSGRDIHVVDFFGLADPFLARLPAERPWRIGHFKRRLPAGYISSLRKGRNEIEDPGLASFYEDVRLVTVGPLWSRERWNAILRLNLGVDDPRLEAYRLDYTGVQWSQVPGWAARASDRPGPLTFERGLVVYLPRPVRVGALAVSLLTPGTYSVILSNGREEVSTEQFAFDGKPSAPSVRQMSPQSVGSRVDRIRIQPVDAKPPFVLARLELRP
jgi:hypothetical protein